MSRYHVNHTTKIAQLADQAHEESNTVYNKRLETERADSVIFFDIFNQKFAELIVQECLDTIQRGIDNGGGANEDIVLAGKLALFYAYRNIQYRFGIGDYKDQEHFGVEE